MRSTVMMTLVLCAGVSVSALAQDVTCESVDNARRDCEMDTHGVVKMVRQLSKASCREGSDWGLSKHAVWVDHGCRAVFRNEGSRNDMPMASTSDSARQVTCESTGNARTECEMDTHGVVKIARQLSKSSCREGTDWGTSKHAVWVENGCRAVFENVGNDERGHHEHHGDAGRDAGRDSTASHHGMSGFNAKCPLGIEVHGDDGGYVYINGEQASVKRLNDDAYDAVRGDTTISVSRNPDSTLSVMYTKGREGGICRVE